MRRNMNNGRFNGLRTEKVKFEQHWYNNCYTYAINQSVNHYDKEPYDYYSHCQPGNLGGRQTATRKKFGGDYSQFVECIKEDLQPLGLELIPSTYDEYVDDPRAWKIAYCYCDSDYHFYRQNRNGTWSHKMGEGSVRTYDRDGNTIYNPETCNRGKYDKFVGFFIIRPIKH